jgi:hypothetical protein
MAYGRFDGMTIDDPRLRAQFTREAVLASDWYTARLRVRQEKDVALWNRHLAAIKAFRNSGMTPPSALDLDAREAAARTARDRAADPSYLNQLVGTIGADPFSQS